MENKALETNIKEFLSQRLLDLTELKWIQEGRSHILQVSISHPDGTMDLDTCGQVSLELSPYLDTLDIPYESYVLEVCSPGAERVLVGVEDIERALGKLVKIQFLHPLNKSLEWTGTLVAFDGNKGTIEVRIKSVLKKIEFEYINIVRIRLAVL